MADDSFLPEPQFPDDLNASDALDVLDKRLVDPTVAPPNLIVKDDPPPPYGRSWAFDFTTNRLVANSNGVAETRGLATLRTWIEKCLRTDRGAHPIHPDGYGIVGPFSIIGIQLADISSDDVQSRISDALTPHPSITGIEDFAMTYDTDGDDALYVDFTVTLADGQVIQVNDLQLT